MSSIAKIQRNFQITIPADIREKVHLKVGDLVDFEVTENGICIKPQETIDRSQAWFWSKKWQAEEKKVEDDFRKGKVLKSKNVGSFLKELDKG
ncbi:MAG: AbrB/MazE/SpoVT family DNA-binding domain-containing protein [Candidatus Scalinduaceae bacterium]